MKKCFLLLMALFLFVPMAAAQTTVWTSSGTLSKADPTFINFTFDGKIKSTDTLLTASIPAGSFKSIFDFPYLLTYATNDSVKITCKVQGYYSSTGSWHVLNTLINADSTKTAVTKRDTLSAAPDSLRFLFHGVTGNNAYFGTGVKGSAKFPLPQ